MPDILEILLWCAALATWLMLLFAFTGKGMKSVSSSVRRLVESALGLKANRK